MISIDYPGCLTEIHPVFASIIGTLLSTIERLLHIFAAACLGYYETTCRATLVHLPARLSHQKAARRRLEIVLGLLFVRLPPKPRLRL